MSPANAKIDAEVKGGDVVLFMKGTPQFPMCGFSGRVVQILDYLGVPYKGVNVLEDADIRQGIKDYSNWPTIPQLYVKGEFVGGCDITTEMFQSGELQQMLTEKGIPLAAKAGCVSDKPDADAWRAALPGLEARYRERHRAYHDIAHVRDLLGMMEQIRPLLVDPRAFEIAIWFHDAIYDPRAHDNEEASAALVRPTLAGLADEATIARVEALVMATSGHNPPKDINGDPGRDIAYFIDADLSSLGATPAIFDRNSRNIRHEYRHVPEAEFNAGRARILKGFLDRRPIYLTRWFFDRHEAQARENLTRGLIELGYRDVGSAH